MNDRWKTTFKDDKIEILPNIEALNEYAFNASRRLLEHILKIEEDLIYSHFSFDELLRIKDCIQKEINQRNMDKAGLNPNYNEGEANETILENQREKNKT